MIRMKKAILTAFLTSLSFLHMPFCNSLHFNGIIFVNDDEIDEKITCLCLDSTPGDLIGKGETKYYTDKPGVTFSISVFNQDRLTIIYSDANNEREYWNLSFTAPFGQILAPGIYRNVNRFNIDSEKKPHLDVSGCGRGCNTVGGEFEILELVYGNDGKVESFAANFMQLCETIQPPLFGNIRYNSTIPIEERYINTEKLNSVFYVMSSNNYQTFYEPHSIKSDGSNFSFSPLYNGVDGIEISITEENNQSWLFVFAAPLDSELKEGYYPWAVRYPLQRFCCPSIAIKTPKGIFKVSDGNFSINNIETNDDGEIISLSIDFYAEDEKDRILSGGIRFNSTDPIEYFSPRQYGDSVNWFHY